MPATDQLSALANAIVHDVRFSLRSLRRSAGFGVTAVCTLALGIGANTAIFSLVRGVLLRPLPYPNSNRVVALWERNPRQGFDRELVTPGDFADWRSRAQSFEQLAFSPAWPGARTIKLVDNAGAERESAAYVSANYFSVLGVNPTLGRTFLPEEDRKDSAAVAILSHSLWLRRFAGRHDVVGTGIRLTGYRRQDFVVVGVMPPGFHFPERTDVWLPAGQMGVTIPAPGSSGRGGPWLEVIALLTPGVSIDHASSELNTIAAELVRQSAAPRLGSQVKVVRLQDQIVGSMRAGLFALLGAVSCLLLIACVNVATLLLGRSNARRREMAVRVALGAGKIRLMSQVFVETLLLFVSGAILGILGASWAAGIIKTSLGDRLPRLSETAIDWTVLGYTAAICLVAGVLFGLIPASQAVNANIGEAIGENSRVGGSGLRSRRLWSVLIVAQVAMASMLLVGAGLFARSLILLQSVDPGFHPERTLAIGLDMTGSGAGTRPQALFAELLDRVRTLPGVASAGGASLLPLQTGGWEDRPGGGWSNQGFIIENQPRPHEQAPMTADPRVVTPGFFETMRIPLRAGRLFSGSDGASSPQVVIINETMSRRYWHGMNPVGQRISFTDERREPPKWMEVVGVVGDTRTAGLDAPPRPEFMLPFDQSVWYEADLVVRTSVESNSIAAAVRREVRTLNRNISITHVRAMEEFVSESILQPRLRTLVLGAFSALALILASVGLYGVLSYSVMQRRQEIGIRMALGATQAGVLKMIVGRGLRTTILGIVIGSAGALAEARALRSLLYGVSANDFLAFSGSALLLLLVALLSSYVPARRAMRVDPAVVLRSE